MSTDYSLVEYGPEFKERVLALQTYLLGPHLERNRAYFEWKHERNPYFTSPVAILAVRDGALVGMRTLMGSCWEVGRGRPPVILPYADDFVIAPEHRSTGLARAIMASVTERARTLGAPYVVNLSAGPVTALQSLAAGWRSAGPLLPIGRLRRGSEPLPAVGMTGRDTTPFSYLDQHLGHQPGADAIVVSRTPRPAEMARLIERRGYDGRIRHLRDVRFFEWRFQNPLHDYRFLFQGDDQLTGYLVLQTLIEGPDDRNVGLVDWEASNASGLGALLQFAISRGHFAEIQAWEAAQPAETSGLLGQHHFRPFDPDSRQHGFPAVLVQTTGTVSQEWLLGEHRVLDPDSWDMRRIYSMQG